MRSTRALRVVSPMIWAAIFAAGCGGDGGAPGSSHAAAAPSSAATPAVTGDLVSTAELYVLPQ